MFITEASETLKSNDSIYHYTDLNTAIEYILFEKRLRLPKRITSNDPIENLKPFFSYSEAQNERLAEEARKIRDLAIAKINSAKQLCFCMNDVEKISHNSNPKFPHEYFGFMKPRMWDQYSKSYKGACLVFSLSKLKENAVGMLNQKIEYINYEGLKFNHLNIDESRIQNEGTENYWKEYAKRIEDIMFRKHVDYCGENEFRFLAFSDNEFEYIDIENCLSTIIVPENYTNEFSKKSLRGYAKENGVELMFIRWDTDGVGLYAQEVLDRIARNL